jgi:hypothetical protein
MSIIKVKTGGITADAITDALIADDVVGTEHLTANEVDTTALGADAVTAAQIADDAISEEHLDVTAITGHTAETSIADGDTLLIHDASASALRKMTKANFVSGIGGTNTPAFLAYPSSDQSIANATQVVVAFNTEVFDTDNCYDTSTYRFTPNVAGKYFVYAQTASNNTDDFDAWETQIYKNGTSGTALAFAGVRHENKDGMHSSVVVDMNGSSDYLTVTCYQNRGQATNLRGARYWSFFGAYRIIE